MGFHIKHHELLNLFVLVFRYLSTTLRSKRLSWTTASNLNVNHKFFVVYLLTGRSHAEMGLVIC